MYNHATPEYKCPICIAIKGIENEDTLIRQSDIVYKDDLVTAFKICLAMKKSYSCDGITTLQNNEPAGGQHAFHYHFHVFPRYEGDALHKNMMNKKSTTQEERKSYAEKIKSQL